MEKGIEYIDVLAEEKRHDIKVDLESFEYTCKAEITGILSLTEKEKLYRIRIIDKQERRNFTFLPGQFVMLELPGIGEAPFSISSSPARHGHVELCIRTVGNLTSFLSRTERGVQVGISGPFGNAFPVEKMYGHDIVLVAGGLGIAPLRAPLLFMLENRSSFEKIDLIYGTKRPGDLLFDYEYDKWRRCDIKLHIIVDEPDDSWGGAVGLPTDPLQKIIDRNENVDNLYAIACGPPVMFKPVCKDLVKSGVSMRKVFVSLERRMHCGRGKCCRCNIGSTYTCLEGPVFDYWSVRNLKEAI